MEIPPSENTSKLHYCNGRNNANDGNTSLRKYIKVLIMQ